MRILVEQSGHPLMNLGDVSMLQVTVERLSRLWSNPYIEVLTSSPERLASFCPYAKPLSTIGQTFWHLPILGKFHKLLPDPLANYWYETEWDLRHKFPHIFQKLIQLKLKNTPFYLNNINLFLEAIQKADLVVCSGGGYITDEFPQNTSMALGILGIANNLGKTTVMLGQGFGPLKNSRLRSQAKAVLPNVDLITLREKHASLPLLTSLGVSHERVITTGDDSIELAYNLRPLELGYGIGINLRMAKYASVSLDIFNTIRLAIQTVVKNKNIPAIPIPISEYDSDAETINQLLIGLEKYTSQEQEQNNYLHTPEAIIKQVGKCRIVLTGSYHAGVFALAQGISVVGLAQSQYYVDKFLGLADQFGHGCQVVFLNEDKLFEKLIDAINLCWENSFVIREKLLESAFNQIKLSYQEYEKIKDFFR